MIGVSFLLLKVAKNIEKCFVLGICISNMTYMKVIKTKEANIKNY